MLDAVERSDFLLVRLRVVRLDASVAQSFAERLEAILRDRKGRVVLDMSGIEFIDSMGLGALVRVFKKAAGGGRLELAGLAPAVAKVFQLTRMDTVFTIHKVAPVN